MKEFRKKYSLVNELLDPEGLSVFLDHDYATSTVDLEVTK